LEITEADFFTDRRPFLVVQPTISKHWEEVVTANLLKMPSLVPVGKLNAVAAAAAVIDH